MTNSARNTLKSLCRVTDVYYCPVPITENHDEPLGENQFLLKPLVFWRSEYSIWMDTCSHWFVQIGEAGTDLTQKSFSKLRTRNRGRERKQWDNHLCHGYPRNKLKLEVITQIWEFPSAFVQMLVSEEVAACSTQMNVFIKSASVQQTGCRGKLPMLSVCWTLKKSTFMGHLNPGAYAILNPNTVPCCHQPATTW